MGFNAARKIWTLTGRGTTAALNPPKPPPRSFERRPTGLYQKADADSDFVIRPANLPPHLHEQSEHFDFSPSNMPALSLDLGPMCVVNVTGWEKDFYSCDLHATVRCDNPQQVPALLQRLSFTREGGTLVLKTPPWLEHVRCQSRLDVFTPTDRPVVVTGNYGGVEVFAINAPVTISTTHGRISLFDVSGDTNANPMEGGSIVFVGRRGRAYLNADLGIDIKLTDPNYDGIVHATAKGNIYVLVPRGFSTGFEADGRQDAHFVCTGDKQAQVRSRKKAGRVTLASGSSEPPLRFTSLSGAVLIDSDTNN